MSEATRGGHIAPIHYGRRYTIESYPSDVFVPERTSNGTASVAGIGALLWRRRWVIAGVALGAALVAVLVAKQITPLFTADGAIEISSSKLAIPQVEAVTLPQVDDGVVRSEMAVLGSRDLLREVAQQLNLAKLPEFNPWLRPKDTSLLARLNPMPWLHSLMAGRAPKKSVTNQQAMVEAAVEDTLNRHLMLVNDGRNHVINIYYSSQDPQLASQIVNTLMTDYVSQYVENNLSATVAANSALQKRADQLKADLDTAETKLQDFTKRTGLLETPQGTVNGQQVTDISVQLANARANLAQTESAYQEIEHTIRTRGYGALASDPNVLSSPIIQSLRQQEAKAEAERAAVAARVGPRHPDMIAANRQVRSIQIEISQQIRNIASSLHSQMASAQAQVDGLQRRMDQLTRAAGTATEQQNLLQALKDDVAGKRKLYDQFLLTVAQTAKPGDKQLTVARIISQAEAPIGPSSPRIGVIGFLAGTMGSLLAVAGVLGHNQLDKGFESQEDVEDSTGLPFFAAVPTVRAFGRRRIERYVLDHPAASFTEALRALRARVWWATRNPDVKSVLVTSSVPGEGKTSFAFSLARLAANEGHRVLFLECDFRRPKLDRMLPLPAIGGAPNFLADVSRWRDWIGVDPASGLHYLSAPNSARNITPLLEAGRLDILMREARGEYDLIVVDSPPIMRVPDAMLLARSVDVVMMMVRWRQTRKRVVQEAIRRLYIQPEKVAGIVLTQVDPRNAEQDMYTGYDS